MIKIPEGKKSFILHNDYWRYFKKLTAYQKAHLLDCIFAFNNNNKEQLKASLAKLDPRADMLWETVLASFEREIEAWQTQKKQREKRLEQRKKSNKKTRTNKDNRGQPRTTKDNQHKTPININKVNGNVNDNVNVSVNGNVSVNENVAPMAPSAPLTHTLDLFKKAFPKKVIDIEELPSNIDINLLIQKIKESTKFLMKNYTSTKSLNWLVENYQAIIDNEYQDNEVSKKLQVLNDPVQSVLAEIKQAILDKTTQFENLNPITQKVLGYKEQLQKWQSAGIDNYNLNIKQKVLSRIETELKKVA